MSTASGPSPRTAGSPLAVSRANAERPRISGPFAGISRDPAVPCLTPDCDSPRRGRFTLSGVACCLTTLNIVLTTHLFQTETPLFDPQPARKTHRFRLPRNPGGKLELHTKSGKRPAREPLRPRSQQERMTNKRRLVSARQGFVFVRIVTPISCVSLMWITGRRKPGNSPCEACAAGAREKLSFPCGFAGAGDRPADRRIAVAPAPPAMLRNLNAAPLMLSKAMGLD